MRFSSFLVLVLVTMVLGGCHFNLMNSKTAGVADQVTFPMNDVDCSPVNGTVMKFGMIETAIQAGLNFEEEADAVKKALTLEGDFYTTATRKTRIDVCVDEINLKVYPRRMVVHANENGAGAWIMFANIYSLESWQESEGLLQALQTGDTSQVDILFENQDATKSSVRLKGWSVLGKNILTVSRYLGSNPNQVADRKVEFGGFIAENPFDIKWVCGPRVIDVQPVRLSYTLCNRGKIGNYMDHRFDALDIVDTSPNLSQPVSVKFAKDANEFVKVKKTHHGLTDEYTFALDEVTYNVAMGALTITYKDGTVVKHELDCDHVSQCGIAKVDPNLPKPM